MENKTEIIWVPAGKLEISYIPEQATDTATSFGLDYSPVIGAHVRVVLTPASGCTRSQHTAPTVEEAILAALTQAARNDTQAALQMLSARNNE